MKKTVLIELDKARNLRLGVNQLATLQDLGVDLNKSETMGLRELRAFFFVALVWEDKSLTLEKTGDLLDDAIAEHGVAYLSEKIQASIQNFTPQGKN